MFNIAHFRDDFHISHISYILLYPFLIQIAGISNFWLSNFALPYSFNNKNYTIIMTYAFKINNRVTLCNIAKWCNFAAHDKICPEKE